MSCSAARFPHAARRLPELALVDVQGSIASRAQSGGRVSPRARSVVTSGRGACGVRWPCWWLEGDAPAPKRLNATRFRTVVVSLAPGS